MSESLIPSTGDVDVRLGRRVSDLDYFKRLRRLVDAACGGPDPVSPDMTKLFPALPDLDVAIEAASTEVALLRRQKKLSTEQAEITAKLGVKTTPPPVEPPSSTVPSKPAKS